ncbi:MAG: hypothetical protein QM654_14145 [Dysgonamonadaceae bacterium]
MEARMHEMARIFVANGFGFGKYWSGYIFAKNPKDQHFFYLADSKMAFLSAGVDEDGEKTILETSDAFSEEDINRFFKVDFRKKSTIEWLGEPVNIYLCCHNEEKMSLNIKYYMWPAVKIDFSKEIKPNTIVVYDRFYPQEKLENLKLEAKRLGIDAKVEFWSMLKMLTMGDRFGELAPKVCMEMVANARK